jgi:hypothetical protein
MRTLEVRPLHIVVRISRTGIPIPEVAAAHQKIISRHGSVWLGIVGRALSDTVVAKLNQQIKDGADTYAFLVQKNSEFETFRGRILFASFNLPVGEREFVPPYYFESGLVKNPPYYFQSSLVKNMHTWLRLASLELGTPRELEKLVVPSTGNSASFVLTRGMASLLTVCEGSPGLTQARKSD